MTATQHLQLPYLLAAQAQKHVTHNEALRMLDTVVQLSVVSRNLQSPPASVAEGERFVVGSPAEGLWAGRENDVAAWQDGAWTFAQPQSGWLCWVASETLLIAWDGANWTTAIGPNSGSLANPVPLVGVNATADETNRLSVASPASLFNHDGAGHQLKINKNAESDTASQLFQTGFSGRAEIGLTGDDDFHFKVSPDGSTFHEGIVIDKDTGNVAVGHDSPQAALDVDGGVVSRAVAGTYHLSNDGTTTFLSDGASLDLLSFSGLVFAVHLTSGRLGQYLCGGAGTVQVAVTTASPGSLAFASNPYRYVFTNDTGIDSDYMFLLLRARNFA